MDKKELEEKISKLDKEIETRRKKREWKIIFAFTIVFFLLFYFFDKKPEGFMEFAQMLFVSFILSIFHFGINREVFEHYFSADKYERCELNQLRRQLSDIEKKEFEERLKESKRSLYY